MLMVGIYSLVYSHWLPAWHSLSAHRFEAFNPPVGVNLQKLAKQREERLSAVEYELRIAKEDVQEMQASTLDAHASGSRAYVGRKRPAMAFPRQTACAGGMFCRLCGQLIN